MTVAAAGKQEIGLFVFALHAVNFNEVIAAISDKNLFIVIQANIGGVA